MAEGIALDNKTEARRQAATEFLQLVVGGQVDKAYQMHVDLSGKHHNPFFAEGFPALRKAMIENHVQFPNKQLLVKNVLSDGDLVAVHSQIVLRPGEPSVATVHLFRFSGGKIVEMWDIGQPVPTDSPNQDGAF
jgi:predicted SnoaL-like aldol condensation-catalyzing enzyme